MNYRYENSLYRFSPHGVEVSNDGETWQRSLLSQAELRRSIADGTVAIVFPTLNHVGKVYRHAYMGIYYKATPSEVLCRHAGTRGRWLKWRFSLNTFDELVRNGTIVECPSDPFETNVKPTPKGFRYLVPADRRKFGWPDHWDHIRVETTSDPIRGTSRKFILVFTDGTERDAGSLFPYTLLVEALVNGSAWKIVNAKSSDSLRRHHKYAKIAREAKQRGVEQASESNEKLYEKGFADGLAAARSEIEAYKRRIAEVLKPSES